MSSVDSNNGALVISAAANGELPAAANGELPAAAANGEQLAAPVGYRAGYMRMLPVLNSFDDSKLTAVTLSIPTLVVQVSGLLPGLQAVRGRAAKALPEHDIGCFDRLPDCLDAMGHAHACAISPPIAPQQDVLALGAQAATERATLLDEVAHLARHSLIDPKRLEPIRSLSGYKNAAFDLVALVGILRDAWPRIAGKTLIAAETLDRNELLAKRLIDAVAERDRLTSTQAQAQLMRQRAFTLFMNTYDQVRRAVTYLYWDEPELLDTLCPSLYSGQRGKRSDKGSTDATSDSQPPPAPKGSTGTTPATRAGGSPVAPAGRPVIDGQPGGSPFIDGQPGGSPFLR